MRALVASLCLCVWLSLYEQVVTWRAVAFHDIRSELRALRVWRRSTNSTVSSVTNLRG